MTGKDFLKLLGLALFGAGTGGIAVAAATSVGLASGDLEQDIFVGVFQGTTVFTMLLLLFMIRGRPQRRGWGVPVVGCAVILGALFWVCTPLLLDQSEGLVEICAEVLEDAGMMFPITEGLANELGWLLVILFPLLIITAVMDLLLMMVFGPFVLLASPRVWVSGGGLIALEAALVVVGSTGSFAVMDLLRHQLFPPATAPEP